MKAPKKIKSAVDVEDAASIAAQRKWTQDYVASRKYKERLVKEQVADGVTGKLAESRAASTQATRKMNSRKPYQVVNQVGAKPGAILGLNAGDVASTKADTNLSPQVRKSGAAEGSVFLERGYGYTPVPSHEFSHQTTNNLSGLLPNTRQNIWRKTAATSNEYLSNPTEVKARMDAVRYQLKQKGIYDAGTEDFTPAHMQKALADPSISQDPNFQEFRQTVPNAEDQQWLLNNVASTAKQSLPMARKGLKNIKKAANGLQKIQADQANQHQLLSTGMQTVANAALPGLGNAVGVLDGASSYLKNEDGLYKSKVGQVADSLLNPVTRMQNNIAGFGKLLKGDFSGAIKTNFLGDQSELKEAMAAQKVKEQQQKTWATVGTDASTAQMGQYKKGSKKVAHKPIEIEGGEPHFSKKVNGRRTLKQYHPNGPTHEQGGIPVLAAEGDAIVTAKGNKGAQAVAAHKKGDHAAVERIIQKMPNDKPVSKKADGVRGMRTKKSMPIPQAMPTFTPGASVLPNDLSLLSNKPVYDAAQSAGIASTNQLLASQKSNVPSPTGAPMPAAKAGNGLLGTLNSAGQAAPSIYNLGQGLFGNTEKTTRRSYNPALLKYEDMSQPARQASVQAQRGQVANARTMSGGNAGNIRSNANQAFADNATRIGAINNQETGRKLEIQQQNTGIQNDAQLRNNQMQDQSDAYDLSNAAKKSEALAKGLEGISGLSQNSMLMGNQKAADEANLSNLGKMFKNYEYVNGNWQVKKLRKGAKAVKLSKS